MTSRPADPNLGLLIDDRYEIVARMARGGMATVYEGRDRRLERRIAIKVMHPHLAESSDFAARFRREARAAARLSHPNVVSIHDQGTWNGTGYLVMEHVAGTNLREELHAQGALSVGDSLEIVDRVLAALGAAHRAGLVHRDVKPENVMLERASGATQVKVTDFGLAQAVTEASAATTGTVLGTVAYLAPEIVTRGGADPRADVYATGILLFELLTGHPPLQGETPIQIAYQHVHGTIPAPSSAEPWMPQEIDELVAAFTERDPVDRPQDADAAQRLLRRWRAALDPATLARRADVAPAADAPRPVDAGDDGPPPPPAPTGTAPSAPASYAPSRGSSTAEHPTTSEPHLRTSVLSLDPALLSLPIGAIPEPEEAEAGRRSRGSAGRRRVFVALLLLLLAAAAAVALWFTVGPGAGRAVPDVAGLPQDEAVAALEEADLAARVNGRHDDDVPEGTVVTTEPAAGTDVRAGTTIEVVVSQGVHMVTIPDVTGGADGETLTAREAQDALSQAGLGAVTVSQEYDDDVAEGLALALSPAPGATVDHRTPVTLTVSRGPAPVDVPDLVGTAQTAAESELTDLGLTLEVSGRANDDTVPAGAVLSQEPAAGATLRRGESVAVVVSDGPVMVDVPDLTGMQVDEARAALERAGFDVAVTEVLGGFFGTVRDQQPAAGTRAPRGTTVTLTVV